MITPEDVTREAERLDTIPDVPDVGTLRGVPSYVDIYNSSGVLIGRAPIQHATMTGAFNGPTEMTLTINITVA